MPHADVLHRLWPAAAVRVWAGDLELRWLDEDLLIQLADLAGRGIHDPEAMPFETPWSRGTAYEVARNVLTYHWSARSSVSPADWTLELGVLRDGVLVGVQGMHAAEWSVLRRVGTGSWLGRDHQGHGIGARMRVLALHLAFAGLDAAEATSGAFVDNAASNAVSRRVGYEGDGSFRAAREGRAVGHNRFFMSRERWESLRAAHTELLGAPVQMAGSDRFREFVSPEASV
jgi:RimJ/RimL family protein N-acetyltransferase